MLPEGSPATLCVADLRKHAAERLAEVQLSCFAFADTGGERIQLW